MKEFFVQALWAVSPGIVVGIVMAVWNRGQKKRDDREDQREDDRYRSEMLRISLLIATAKLSYAVAMAIKRGSPNGEVEEGIKQYESAMEEFRKFEQQQVARRSAG